MGMAVIIDCKTGKENRVDTPNEKVTKFYIYDVHKAQLCCALGDKLKAVETALDCETAWKYAVQISRYGLIAEMLATALGVTDGVLDELFITASKIKI
jgi:hypothetical protein